MRSSSSDAQPVMKVKATPLPRLKMLAVCATLLVEAICSTIPFPFVGLFVAHLQNISVEEAGYYSGILVGLFMLGQVISCKPWGWLSDTYGRKIPLVSGLFASAWAMLLFGFSSNIYFCCLMRFLHGVLNGNVLIAKIIISDITDETNAAFGFSMVGLLWCVGSVIGPAIGGFLYDPRVNPKLQWMHVKEGSFLARYPAFLVSLVIFVYTIVTWLLCVVVLPETNPHRSKSIRTAPIIGPIFNLLRPKAVTIVGVTDTLAQSDEEGGSGAMRNNAVAEAQNRQERASNRPDVGVVVEPMTYKRALSDPVILAVTLLYMCISSSDMSFGEIMPLWAIAPRDVGGLAMFADSVGVLMLCFAVPTLITTLFFSQMYNAVNNSSRMWQGGMTIFIITVVAFPFAAEVSESEGYWFVLFVGSLRNCVCSALYDVVHLLTAKAAPPGTVGSVYGISQSMAGIVRCAVPFVVAPLFAWSLSGHHIFPFNHYFVFFLSALPLIYSVYVTVRHRIERTQEELALWAVNTADDTTPVELIAEHSVVDYCSFASSLAISLNEHIFAQLETLNTEERKRKVREWMHRAIPRGRNEEMATSVQMLKYEDYRLMSDNDDDDDGKEAQLVD